MADYRELLRRAIDALPENTGANRRAVYEKARSALVAQLRAIDPPLPAREITTHRLNLEDCIREVEHEATEMLLGRFRAVEEVEPEIAPAPEESLAGESLPQEGGVEESVAEDGAEPGFDPHFDDAEDEHEDFVAPEPSDEAVSEPMIEAPVDVEEAEADEAEGGDDIPAVAPEFSPEPETERPEDRSEAGEDDEPAPILAADAAEADDFLPVYPGFEPVLAEPEDGVAALGGEAGEAPYGPDSIEDIIAQAERASAATSQVWDETPEEPSAESGRVVPFAPLAPAARTGETVSAERHFIASPTEAEPASAAPLVDIHGNPLVGGADPAMSSVREVDLDPELDPGTGRAQVSDAQIAIDRAIAALDREARGEDSEWSELEAAEADGAEADGQDEAGGGRPGGPAAFTIFLVISLLLLGGGGIAGYWAWREGYVDLNTLFAQADPVDTTTEVAEATLETEDEVEPAAPANGAANTTPDVPSGAGEVNGAPMPGEVLPFTETETPAPAEGISPDASFEDRLPAEAESPAAPGDPAADPPAAALALNGAQSLLLEEQTGGAAGAVPYSGSVEWSRGTDEMGNPTIVAEASIPARNLEADILLRRNGDASLPASHLMEINFTIAESFIGGSIANLPGVLLKDQELVQGQPLTGASARIVGNSFLFALSSASALDVENNVALLSERGWLDLAMVYGTGRRAILTLEKGEDGDAVFEQVLAEWAALDAAASAAAESEPEA